MSHKHNSIALELVVEHNPLLHRHGKALLFNPHDTSRRNGTQLNMVMQENMLSSVEERNYIFELKDL